MVEKVRQRDYKILIPKDKQRELFTENIGPCVGIAGANGKGAGFLCHVDVPCSVGDLTRAISKLQGEEIDVHGFNIHVVTNLCGILYSLLARPTLCWQLRALGKKGCKVKREIVWNPFGRVGLRVNVDTGIITRTPVHMDWIDKADYDPEGGLLDCFKRGRKPRQD